MRVLKFGGKSLSSKEKMQKISKYIKKIYKNDKKIIIIVSAMGSTTDNLISLSKEFCSEKVDKHSLATLLSTGEAKSAALMAMSLENENLPSKCFQGHEIELTTFGSKTEGLIAYINKNKLEECVNNEVIAVVAGYQGIDKNGETTLLGRGGSDTTATAIASLFNVDAEIYSDFDGVFSGDPRKLAYKKLRSVSYDTMLKMANSGAKVIDSRSISIAKKFGINIISKSTSSPNLSGTKISLVEDNVISVQSISNLTQIAITYSSDDKLKFILKNVFSMLDNVKFYNLNVENKIIKFYIQSELAGSVIFNLSKKLKILSKNKTRN